MNNPAIRDSRLSILRRNLTPKAKQPPASSSGFSASNLVVKSALGILVTAVFGDLIVKRNIEGFFAQKRDIAVTVEAAADEFDKFASDVNEMVRTRRRESLRMNRYFQSRDMEMVEQNYPGYVQVRESAIAQVQIMGNNLVRFADCRRYGDPKELQEENLAKMKQIAAKAKGIFDKIEGARINYLTDKEITAYSKPGKFCPSEFITNRRSHFDFNKQTPVSVQEYFLNFNNKVYNNYKSGERQCSARRQELRTKLIDQCVSTTPLKEAVYCEIRVQIAMEELESCQARYSKQTFARIDDSDFLNLDYRWFLGNEILKAARARYVIRKCEKKDRFWANVMGWSCEEAFKPFDKS